MCFDDVSVLPDLLGEFRDGPRLLIGDCFIKQSQIISNFCIRPIKLHNKSVWVGASSLGGIVSERVGAVVVF